MLHYTLKIVLVIVFQFWFLNKAISQFNLVPNSSFENYDTCPNLLGNINYIESWNVVPINNTTPDFFNDCANPNPWVGLPNNRFGSEPAHTGNGYIGIATYAWNGGSNNYREYIQTQLLSTLIAGENYFIRFYISAADSARYVSNNLGFYFSPIEIVNYSCFPLLHCNLPFIPQFQNNVSLDNRIGWTEITGSFVATGNEQYIIIGNFQDTVGTVATFTGWSPTLSESHAYYYMMMF